MRDFRKLEVWQLGMELVTLVYQEIKLLPNEEKFGLKSQIGRSAVSMPSNIAEGCSRSSNKELSRFLEISLGSSFELETQLEICVSLKYLSVNDYQSIKDRLHLFQKKCGAFRKVILSDLK